MNMLVILANQGAGGHRLGRIISCLNNVYWYNHKYNGSSPLELSFDHRVTGKTISRYHYDRRIDKVFVPLIGERIERYWEPEQINYYYSNVWSKLMQNKKIQALDDLYVHWVLHDEPAYIHKRFPKAKIISLIDDNITEVADRYLKTTSLFPIDVTLKGTKPKKKNQLSKQIASLIKLKPDATELDLWYHLNKGASSDDYYETIFNKLYFANEQRLNFDHKNHLKVSWKTLDIVKIANFLKSSSLDYDYTRLLQNQ
jgi:hypothetical protein